MAKLLKKRPALKHRRSEKTPDEERRANGHAFTSNPEPLNAADGIPDDVVEPGFNQKNSRTLKFPGCLGPLRRLTRRGPWATKSSKFDNSQVNGDAEHANGNGGLVDGGEDQINADAAHAQQGAATPQEPVISSHLVESPQQMAVVEEVEMQRQLDVANNGEPAFGAAQWEALLSQSSGINGGPPEAEAPEHATAAATPAGPIAAGSANGVGAASPSVRSPNPKPASGAPAPDTRASEGAEGDPPARQFARNAIVRTCYGDPTYGEDNVHIAVHLGTEDLDDYVDRFGRTDQPLAVAIPKFHRLCEKYDDSLTSLTVTVEKPIDGYDDAAVALVKNAIQCGHLRNCRSIAIEYRGEGAPAYKGAPPLPARSDALPHFERLEIGGHCTAQVFSFFLLILPRVRDLDIRMRITEMDVVTLAKYCGELDYLNVEDIADLTADGQVLKDYVPDPPHGIGSPKKRVECKEVYITTCLRLETFFYRVRPTDTLYLWLRGGIPVRHPGLRKDTLRVYRYEKVCEGA
ncbi:uncharacterized protein SCHCODRAFT_02717563 [Schizophyllum commune H4-8]|nr:uncharacterized protein SCHCODRAFT_02717563 [Schizophyllum commune H4-8]KAI5886067.1 hypothetical protein SCHCODRAFT_02717563 [Schizophyllum commune H4-8]